jgi:formimidoylglutamate deiminase
MVCAMQTPILPDRLYIDAMNSRQIIEADLTWIPGENGTPGRFAPGVRIAVDDRGMIELIGGLKESPTKRLRHRALLPGFVNVHSHAFQRGLRGYGEEFPEGKGSFWTWREAMYQLVESMDAPTLQRLCVQAFGEMLSAGITTVGEFHYLRHAEPADAIGRSTNGHFAFDEIVLSAAREAGIRIVLINTFYKTGGINQPLAGGQLRFRTNSIDEYWKQSDRLSKLIDPATQSLAAAAHSIRAASIEDIKALHVESIRRGLPFHMHVEEQPQEVNDCVHHYGKPPMALLNDSLDINPLFTAVHCTHTAAADMDDYINAGGNVCINPLTEGNLGDGIPNLTRILKNRGTIALGSDSNLRLCWTEEMRWLEYGQRLSSIQRGICADDAGSVARKLLEIATMNGARCLGVKAGRIAPKNHADFVAIDLESPALTGWTDESLIDAFIFGTGNQAIAEVCVGGTWKCVNGRGVASDK